VRGGEPWLLLNAFVADDRKAAYLVRPDGTGLHQILTDLDADVRSPSWSPDGRHILFSVRDSQNADGAIWTADADGTHPALLYDGRKDGCGAVWAGAWAPDGTRISLICYQGAAGTPQVPNAALVAVLDVRARRLTTLATTHWPDYLDNAASWSPDARTLAFDILHWDPTNQFIDGSRIETAAADGSGKPARLDALDSFAAYPNWSLDGAQIVYNDRDLGNGPNTGSSNLFTMAADGSDVRQLTTASTDDTYRIGHPRWDPDGSRIWVTLLRGGDVTVGWVDPATGSVTELPVKASRPEPRPLP
jgi:Tol biopolymer transport system component